MRAVDLFCGAGGASHGLKLAGYDVTGYDHWQPAVDCHNANGMPAHLHDLSDPTQDDLIPYAPLWWASPPCQPFSAAGAGEGEFDGRDGFPWLLRLVTLRRPDVLIVENVKGLTFHKHSGYFCGVLEGLRALGYVLDWRVLMCADLGVPQTRERCIIVARLDGGPITWPAPTHCETGGMFTQPWVTMAQALGWGMDDRPSFTVRSGGTETGGAEHFTPAARKAMTLHYRQNDPEGNPITCNLDGRPSPTIGTQSQSQSQWIIEAKKVMGSGFIERHGERPPRPIDQPAFAVCAQGSNRDPGGFVWGTNDGQNIRLTIAELATLQGFPADWTWTGTKTQQARQVGNAVPPALAHAVAAANRPLAYMHPTGKASRLAGQTDAPGDCANSPGCVARDLGGPPHER